MVQIVYHGNGDADTSIAQCALQYADQGHEVSVVADDTDVLVLLMCHCKLRNGRALLLVFRDWEKA